MSPALFVLRSAAPAAAGCASRKTKSNYNRPNGEEVAAMRKRVTLGAVLLLVSLPVAELIHARGHARLGSQAGPVATEEERRKLLATGKKIFVDGCAKCHAERGDRTMKSGL